MAVRVGAPGGKVVIGGEEGKVVIGAGTSATIPIYSGEYEVIPKVEEETILQTKGYAMADNVKVKEIPSYEVKNSAGGYTFIVGFPEVEVNE